MLPSSVKVCLASQPMDMRKSIDGLLGLVRSTADADPFGGHLFVFVGRAWDRVKILLFDHGGFVVYYNRLQRSLRPRLQGAGRLPRPRSPHVL